MVPLVSLSGIDQHSADRIANSVGLRHRITGS
jgi:hypothetical protein